MDIEEFIKRNAADLSAEKILELLQEDQHKRESQQIRSDIQERKRTEFKQLITHYQSEIDTLQKQITIDTPLSSEFYGDHRKPDPNHPFFWFCTLQIENHLKTLSPNKAVSYLVECQIQFEGFITKKPESGIAFSGMYDYYEAKGIEYLKAGDVKKYVHLRSSAFRVASFVFKIEKLLKDYKTRAEVMVDTKPEKKPCQYDWEKLYYEIFIEDAKINTSKKRDLQREVQSSRYWNKQITFDQTKLKIHEFYIDHNMVSVIITHFKKIFKDKNRTKIRQKGIKN